MKTKTNELLKIGDKIFLRRGSSLIGFEMIEKLHQQQQNQKTIPFVWFFMMTEVVMLKTVCME